MVVPFFLFFTYTLNVGMEPGMPFLEISTDGTARAHPG